MKLAFLGTLPQWLTLVAVGWLIYMAHNPVASNRAMDVYVENFPSLLEGDSIPVAVQSSVPLAVAVQSSVPLEMSSHDPLKIEWPTSVPMDLMSVGGKEITVSPFGAILVRKSPYQNAPSYQEHTDLGISVDVKSVTR
jgi:hypothetical protein